MKAVTALVIVAAALAGCGSTPAARFYTLSSMEVPAGERARTGPSVGVGPVSVPDVVDRPQMVVRAGANRVQLDELNRWAAPLRSEIGRVVAANIGGELGSAQVTPYPQGAGDAAPDIRVLIDVLRFDLVRGDAAALDALWSIRTASGELLGAGRTVVQEAVASDTYDALAAAQSKALAQLSREIAASLRVGAARPR